MGLGVVGPAKARESGSIGVPGDTTEQRGEPGAAWRGPPPHASGGYPPFPKPKPMLSHQARVPGV